MRELEDLFLKSDKLFLFVCVSVFCLCFVCVLSVFCLCFVCVLEQHIFFCRTNFGFTKQGGTTN